MYPVKKRSPDSPKPSRRRQAINCLNSLLAVTFKRVIISLSLLFIHNPRGIRSGWPRCIFKHAGKIELIFEADVAPNGGDRHPRGAEQQFGLADALILPPAEDADPSCWRNRCDRREGDRQTCWATLAISKWLSARWSLMYWQASRTRLSSGGCSDSLIASMRRSSSCSSRFIANSSE